MLIDWFQDKGDISRIWFTADHHFGHGNIIKFCNRPYSDAKTMDQSLIENWNRRVAPNDTVFHLGDFTFGDIAVAENYFRQLQGRIFVLANEWHHDRRWLNIGSDRYPPCVTTGRKGAMNSASGHPVQLLPPLVVLQIPWLGKGNFPLAITLCHYPIGEWDRKHHGAWHLHGHSHGQYKHIGDGYILDVGVDAQNYCPIHLGDVVEAMNARS